MFTIASLNSTIGTHLNNSSATIVDKKVNNPETLLVSGGAIASTEIPRGAMTIPINPVRLCGRVVNTHILIKINQFGTMEIENSSSWTIDVHWIRVLRIADDCHSYNVQLKLQPSSRKDFHSKLVLQAIRQIEIGQELLLWFSEDLLAMLQMVFLTPANIQSQTKYVCTRCSTLYESPNPLKLHIMLNCGRLSVSDLWNKLAHLLIESKKCSSQGYKNAEFTFKLSPPRIEISSKQTSAVDLSTTPAHALDLKRPTSQPQPYQTSLPTIDDLPTLFRPFSEPPILRNSAFKPFQKLESTLENLSADDTIQHPHQIWPSLVLNQTLCGNQNHQFLANNVPVASDEAHIETLVSNLGKSKEGHVCLYCGKCYSRKYGLKIHIRTHTGYKPLKCKFCLRPFGDPSNLNKHVRLHAEGETPYKCELCGKVLVRRRDLERHLKSRHITEINPGRNMIDEEAHTSEGEEADITEER